ncbi:hypothetical protein LTR27_006503 [Elasticomyces elasticus]|nr:hypothetical protein LTR27_006503 [Elasticomyces elasticus]
MEALTKALQSDTLMKLVIGEGEKSATFYVSKTTLQHTSACFRAAIRNAHLGGGDFDTIPFPEDNLEAWKVLLHWLITRELPAAAELLLVDHEAEDKSTVNFSDHTLCIRCWALGDKFAMPAFQDAVMLRLLESLDSEALTVAEALVGFENTPPGSKLREVMAEELAVELQNLNIGPEDMDEFDGIAGFSSLLVEKVRRLARLNNVGGWRPRMERVRLDAWDGVSPNRYLVSDKESQRLHL